MHSNFYEDILEQLFWYATHFHVRGCYVKCGSPIPPKIRQLTDAHQPYTEPSIEDEVDDHSARPGNFTYAHTLDNGLQRMILKLLNQGVTHENYRTLVIAATFYSSKRGEDKGKLLRKSVKENRDCICFHVCSAVSGKMVELYTQTCTLLEFVEKDEFNTLADQLTMTNLNTKKEARLILKKQCCEIRKHPYWKWFFMHTHKPRRVKKFDCVN